MTITAGQTIKVRGEGGAVSDYDVPKAGSRQRELFEEFLAAGKLFLAEPEKVLYDDDTPVEDDVPTAVPAAAPAVEGVADGTIAEVLAWVDSDPERAAEALAAERDGKQRPTLIEQLEQLTGD